jgi:hypothetical protein
MIATVEAAPVTSPTIEAARQRWAPVRSALGAAWRMPRVHATPASTQADSGSAPAAAAMTRTLPPAIAAMASTRQIQRTRLATAAGCWRPSTSPTKRVAVIESPPLRKRISESSTKAMKLCRPNCSAPRNLAPAMEMAST